MTILLQFFLWITKGILETNERHFIKGHLVIIFEITEELSCCGMTPDQDLTGYLSDSYGSTLSMPHAPLHIKTSQLVIHTLELCTCKYHPDSSCENGLKICATLHWEWCMELGATTMVIHRAHCSLLFTAFGQGIGCRIMNKEINKTNTLNLYFRTAIKCHPV